MEQRAEFNDLLAERRKDTDILWVSRPMDPLLPHKLPPESKYSREQAIEAVLNNEAVKSAITHLALVKNIDKSLVSKEARMMVNEMASKAHLATVRWLGVIITKVVKRVFSHIYINDNLLYELKKEMQLFQVQYVYAPSHRSYLDFILLSYILFSYNMALPNIASGMDFYQMYIVGELLRKTGAFYMRRSFSDDILYKRVFRAYVQSLVSHSDRAIEFFIEGTRSRSLKSITPKYGLLSTILEGLFDGSVPDIHFVPISINYERPLEELLFAYELLGVPKPKESTTGLFRSLSILQKPFGYGRVYFNVGEPISAQQFLTMQDRKARVLSPYAKLPSTAVENLAYSIIDSHKRNTVLTTFNVIALLFNEKVQTCPNNLYTLDSLIEDYLWIKTLFHKQLKAKVHMEIQSNTKNEVRNEILNTLRTHEELLMLDSTNTLILKNRHKVDTLQKTIKVKGHKLSEQTMNLAVSAINLAIYINPTFAFLVKPAITTVIVGMDGVELGAAYERYMWLTMLLSTEFVIPPHMEEAKIKSEWEETLNFLLNENCLYIRNGSYLVCGENLKLFSLLTNTVIPFIDAIYITCSVLLEWDESTLNYPTMQGVLIESQKRAEKAFLMGKEWGQHPYCLSLDLFNSTLSNFVMNGIIVPYGKRDTYRANKIKLAQLLAQLQNLSFKRPSGSYVNMTCHSPISTNLMAKL